METTQTYRTSDLYIASYLLSKGLELEGIDRRTRGLPTMLSKQEFNTRFLLATQPYIPKVALALIRECREDIELFGLEYAQRKWARFTELKKEGGQTSATQTF